MVIWYIPEGYDTVDLTSEGEDFLRKVFPPVVGNGVGGGARNQLWVLFECHGGLSYIKEVRQRN